MEGRHFFFFVVSTCFIKVASFCARRNICNFKIKCPTFPSELRASIFPWEILPWWHSGSWSELRKSLVAASELFLSAHDRCRVAFFDITSEVCSYFGHFLRDTIDMCLYCDGNRERKNASPTLLFQKSKEEEKKKKTPPSVLLHSGPPRISPNCSDIWAMLSTTRGWVKGTSRSVIELLSCLRMSRKSKPQCSL